MRLKGQQAELYREFKPGYRVQPNGGGHVKVLDPDGNIVRFADGQPLTLATTPGSSGGHYHKRLRATLVDLGVIERDPAEALMLERAAKPKLEFPEPEAVEPPPGFTFNNPYLERRMPEVVLNVTWEEYMAMEEAIGLVFAKGPRTVARMEPFVKLVDRARLHMEKKVATVEVVS